MFIWQHVNIDPAEIEKTKKFFYETAELSTYFWLKVPLKEFLGLAVQEAVLIQFLPKVIQELHTDMRLNGNRLALNFPLENCDGSVTEFWEPTSTNIPTRPAVSSSMSTYTYYPKYKCRKISEFKISDGPVIFRTDVPHLINNFNNDKIRRVISVRFIEDPWHLVDVPPDQRF